MEDLWAGFCRTNHIHARSMSVDCSRPPLVFNAKESNMKKGRKSHSAKVNELQLKHGKKSTASSTRTSFHLDKFSMRSMPDHSCAQHQKATYADIRKPLESGLDFRRSLDLRPASWPTFPSQRLVIEPRVLHGGFQCARASSQVPGYQGQNSHVRGLAGPSCRYLQCSPWSIRVKTYRYTGFRFGMGEPRVLGASPTSFELRLENSNSKSPVTTRRNPASPCKCAMWLCPTYSKCFQRFRLLMR